LLFDNVLLTDFLYLACEVFRTSLFTYPLLRLMNKVIFFDHCEHIMIKTILVFRKIVAPINIGNRKLFYASRTHLLI